MKKLELHDGDPEAAFEAIRKAKRKDIPDVLAAIAERVYQRFDAYQVHAAGLEHLPDTDHPFDAEQRAALEHCYEVETIPLGALKQRIRECQSPVAMSLCQYCGINYPGTFDHYLPRSASAGFPEFAVYIPNLLPCCFTCNTRRGAGWRNADGERTCLHLYYDEIEETERFLFACIELDKDGRPMADFWVETEQGKNRAFGRRYERHFNKLNLRERFRDSAPAKLDALRIDIMLAYPSLNGDVHAALMDFLHKGGVEYQRSLGANNWEVALRFAAAESQPFIDYCLSQPTHNESL